VINARQQWPPHVAQRAVSAVEFGQTSGIRYSNLALESPRDPQIRKRV
jgi:hypothetical protein